MDQNKFINFINTHPVLFYWPLFIIYYFVIRFFTGVNYGVIYGLIAVLLLFRISFEKIALIFFFLCIVAYIVGREVEANHYLSFVYGFLFLHLLKNLYALFKHRLTNG